MELPELEPMKVMEIFGRSFKLYLANFLRFLSIVAVVHIPTAAIRMPYVLHKAAEKAAEAQDKAGLWESFVLDLSPSMLLGFLATVVGFVSSAAIFTSISGHYLGKDIGFGQAYRLAWSKIKTILMLSLIWTVCFIIAPLALRSSTAIMSIGREPESASAGIALVGVMAVVSLALWVAILILTLWFGLTVQCIMADGLSAWQSMKRSKGLVKGNMWRVFGLWAILMVIGLAVGWIAGWRDDLFLKTLLGQSITNVAALRHLRVTLVGALFGPLVTVAMTLLYYDLRARKSLGRGILRKDLGQMKLEMKDYELIG